MTVNFGNDLGIVGGRVYRLDDNEYELMETFGSARATAAGRRVPRRYAAIEAVLDSGLVVMDRNAPSSTPSWRRSSAPRPASPPFPWPTAST